MKIAKVLFISVLVLVVALASFIYIRSNKSTLAKDRTTKQDIVKTNLDDLIVVSQTPKNEVIVESATLEKNGFLVARLMDDGELSQIVEMSKPLAKGTHKDITIPLGSVDVSDSELIVMIYEDYDNDEVFNDLDMPALNENGNMTARYVATGKPLPASIREGESAGMTHNMAGMKTMAKVRYTDKGFAPNKVEVSVGSTVEFINQSSMDMWVASVPHPAHSKLPTFDQFRLYKKGAIYRYVFDKKGTWEYHDHINPSLGGIVVVN